MENQIDYIVIGSGASGVQAAQTLLENKKKVMLLDVGFTGTNEDQQLPQMDFEQLRRTDKNQIAYILGTHFEGFSFQKLQTGAQLTPARKHIVEKVDELTPLVSENFHAMESLAKGGLATGWGASCCVFSKAELEKMGLNESQMRMAYEVIAKRIGISAQQQGNDVENYTTLGLKNIQKASDIDANSKQILVSYQNKKEKINQAGFYLGRPALALLTEKLGHRAENPYFDMDFYSDTQQAVYRPWITLNELLKDENFTYKPNQMVLKFIEKELIEVQTLDVLTGGTNIFYAKKLILAAGALGTARIVLRSFQKYETKISLLCNPYRYIPTLQWKRLGKLDHSQRTSLTQLLIAQDENGKNEEVAIAQLYSYRSLMLFRLIKEAPLNFKDSGLLMQYLSPAITIAGLHFPDHFSEKKHIYLQKNEDSLTKDILKVNYELTKTEEKVVQKKIQQFKKILFSLGCFPLKVMNPGFGASIHYAGTLPYSVEEKILTTQTNGKLAHTQNIYIADGSSFTYLPAKGLTFSLMANAHVVALNSLKNEA